MESRESITYLREIKRCEDGKVEGAPANGQNTAKGQEQGHGDVDGNLASENSNIITGENCGHVRNNQALGRSNIFIKITDSGSVALAALKMNKEARRG
jgi:hypothetical protein